MPQIVQRQAYNGADAKVSRLGLEALVNELEEIITDFDLRVEESRNANGGGEVRKLIDARFEAASGWKKKQPGHVDWIKCLTKDGIRVCVGVKLQMSACDDLLVIDIVQLREELDAGSIDVGFMIVPSDRTSVFHTGREARFTDGVKAAKLSQAHQSSMILVGIDFDGTKHQRQVNA